MKTILITGAAHGLGKELAYTFKNNHLILVDKDADALQELGEALEANYFICDLSDKKALKQLVSNIDLEYDTIDILMNNAGQWISGKMSCVDDEKFSHMNTLDNIYEVLNTNVFGSIALTKSLIKKLENGLILNVNSQSGVNVETPCPIYNASKQAMRAFRRAIQEDLETMNIKITDIYPGLINTSFYKHADSYIPDDILKTGLDVKDVAQAIVYVVNLPDNVRIPSLEITSFNQ